MYWGFRDFDENSIENRMCRRKIGHNTKKQAMGHISRMDNRKDLHAYKCPICRKWHVGHKK